MWHSDHDHTDEEIKVLRELEYDLFMFDPGFRQLWNNDFEAYFQSLFNEEAWENKMHQAFSNAGTDISRQMMLDPQFAEYMKEQAIIEEVLSGELKPENAPVEMRHQLEKMMAEQDDDAFDVEIDLDEPDIKDQLYIDASKWANNISKQVGPLYEQFGDINLFRILANCYIVAGKIAFAHDAEMGIDGQAGYQWQTDRVGYTLALTSMHRCLESLKKLGKNPKIAKKLGAKSFINTGQNIKRQLIDRLDEIEQQRLKKNS